MSFPMPVEFPFCYAHTTDKNIAKLFRKTRNMSVFREVIRKINKEDVELFPSDYYRDLKEISIYFGSDHRMVLPLTRTEYWALENSSEVFHDIIGRHRRVLIITHRISVYLYPHTLDILPLPSSFSSITTAFSRHFLALNNWWKNMRFICDTPRKV